MTTEVSHGLNTVENLEVGDYDTRDNEERKDVAWEDVEATLPHLPKDFRDVVQVMRATGARPSEVLNLRAGDVERVDGDLWHAVLGRHKTAHRGKVRVLVFDERAQEVLRRRLLRAKGGLLFRGRTGPYDCRDLSKAVRRACKDAKVKPWTPYMIRHAVGTDVATKLSEADAGVVLGHSSGKVTARYVHNLLERTKRVVRRWLAVA